MVPRQAAEESGVLCSTTCHALAGSPAFEGVLIYCMLALSVPGVDGGAHVGRTADSYLCEDGRLQVDVRMQVALYFVC